MEKHNSDNIGLRLEQNSAQFLIANLVPMCHFLGGNTLVEMISIVFVHVE